MQEQLELDLWPSPQLELFGFDYLVGETLREYIPVLLDEMWEYEKRASRLIDLMLGR
jgi:hypothetical protein